MKVILASASERRKELLKRIIKNYEVLPSDFLEETVLFSGNCSKYVMELSKGKVLDVGEKIKYHDALIIGCDTIVSFNNEVLGKPRNKQEAFNTLKLLCGNTHKVYTGLTVLNKATNDLKSDFVCTEVKFSNITDEMIKRYIDTNEPMDKAGSYGIQDYGGVFVEKINGCYYNVVGLPLNKLYSMLIKMGVNL
ncbi:Maf-like protein [Clostridium rectalis]|uniref:Maf-like protein n=1 Tax=Clostridium rectalis TaxID=2040295 RepID=UPI000F6348D4|nr:Maf-like protein [Clostridium rectalis]